MANLINGWQFIEKWLVKRNKHQNDLARLLAISPPAISQIKKGSSLLSPTQISKIINFLQIPAPEVKLLYQQIISTRLSIPNANINISEQSANLHNPEPQNPPENYFVGIPIIPLSSFINIFTQKRYLQKKVISHPYCQKSTLLHSPDSDIIGISTSLPIANFSPLSGSLTILITINQPPLNNELCLDINPNSIQLIHPYKHQSIIKNKKIFKINKLIITP